jgi:hypothetical protein
MTRRPISLEQTEVVFFGPDSGAPTYWQTVVTDECSDWDGDKGAPLSLIHSVQIQFSYKDQGWGNRKGTVSIVKVGGRGTGDFEPKSAQEVTSTSRVYGKPAEHEWEVGVLSYHPGVDSKYEIWCKAGGGGGHSVHTKCCRARVIVFEYL